VVSFLLAFPPKSYTHSSSPRACYVPCPSHPPWRGHSNYTWRRVQVMKILITQFSRTSCHFIPRRSKYSPQRPFKTCQRINVLPDDIYCQLFLLWLVSETVRTCYVPRTLRLFTITSCSGYPELSSRSGIIALRYMCMPCLWSLFLSCVKQQCSRSAKSISQLINFTFYGNN
jgi:hypothetical protein